MRLTGKIALVTGGTTGIGLATAKLFQQEGATVVVTGKNPKTLAIAKTELAGVIEVWPSDSGSEADVAQLFADFAARFGRLDILFVNAAIVPRGTIEAMTAETFDDTLRINVKGPWLALKHATPLLGAGSAVVLNGSVNARLGMPGGGAYAASKAALRSLGRTAASELAPRGVRVNVLSPGPTDSGVIDKMMNADEAASTKAHLADKILFKRLGRRDEIARAALFLASDDSSFMTGEEIIVDGGMTRV
jgi:NAD(P)-dependent dehydrogenase (short-subunit alcohol dehydrogenase family)